LCFQELLKLVYLQLYIVVPLNDDVKESLTTLFSFPMKESLHVTLFELKEWLCSSVSRFRALVSKHEALCFLVDGSLRLSCLVGTLSPRYSTLQRL
jgi:hypothetical protein